MLTNITGNIWKCGDNVVAYDILPMERKTTGGIDRNEMGKYAFETLDPEFAEKARRGDYEVVVAGENFGGGAKSIEHPVHALVGAGIKLVIAESVARYFYRNAINNGLPVIVCKGITKLFESGDPISVDISTARIKNTATGEEIQGERLDEQAQAILEAGGYINYTKKRLGIAADTGGAS